MSLVALNCPACGAPIKIARGTCPYCGATVERAGARFEQVKHVILLLARVGPSNRERVVTTLIRFGVAEDAAKHLVATSPSELDYGPADDGPSVEMRTALFEAGASVQFEIRTVEVMIEPPRTVRLEAVGPHFAKVLFAFRDNVELDIQTARDQLRSAPCTLGPPMPVERAQQFLAALLAAGATARLD